MIKNTMASLDDFTKIHIRTYEEAISLTGFGKFHYRLLLCCGLCLTSFVMECLSTSYVVPSAECDFNMTSSEKGLLTSIVYAGIIVSAHMWGFLTDTQGRRRMLIITLFLNSVCSLIASLVPAYIYFVICRFLNGFFLSCVSSVSFVFLGEFHSNRTRAKSMVLVCAFFAIGTTSLPALAWAVIPQTWSIELPWCTFNSWRIFVILITVPTLITSLLLWSMMPESPKYLLAAGREKEALTVLQKIYSVNTGNTADLYPVTGLILEDTNVHATESLSPLVILRHMWEQTKPVFMPPYLISTILACCVQFGLYASSNGLILWMPEIFNKMSEYELLFPNQSTTMCTAFSTLHDIHSTVSFPEMSLYNFTEAQSAIVRIPPTDPNTNTDGLLLTDSISHEHNISIKLSYAVNSSEIPASFCQPHISYQSFQNTMIMGAVSGIGVLIVGYVLKYIEKKPILLVCLLATGGCGIGLHFAKTATELLVLSTFIFLLPTMCVSVINNVVVDAFPTNLRAMALGLSLMMGRIGTICSSMLFGTLLEANCTLLIFLVSGFVIVGAILSIFIPVVKLPKPKNLRITDLKTQGITDDERHINNQQI